jgi:hypothetical protein
MLGWAEVADAHLGQVSVGIATRPDAELFRGVERTPVAARVCGGCGYVELYATDPKALVDAALKRSRG